MENQSQKSLEQDALVTRGDEAFVEEMLKGFIQALVIEESLPKPNETKEPSA